MINPMIFKRDLLKIARSVIGSTGIPSMHCWVRLPNRSCCSYIQGQSPEPRVREYFYFIDHQGMLFLDDTRIKNFTSCFKAIKYVLEERRKKQDRKLRGDNTFEYSLQRNGTTIGIYIGTDKKFLMFFFRRLRMNDTGRYVEEFPFISLCGSERNFVKCDDLPIVFTHVIKKSNPETQSMEDRFSYGHAGDLLTVPFEPRKIFMNAANGRVYHPGPTGLGGIGLVKSSLAIEFSSLFSFKHGVEHGPTQFLWRDKKYDIDTEWHKDKSLKLV